MSFVLSKVLWVVAAPGNLLTAVLLLGVLLQRSRWRRLGDRLTLAAAAVLAALLIFPVDVWLTQALEQRFPQPQLPARVDGIIVLGGMVDPASAAVWGRPRLNGEADRLTELVWLARRYPEARLVFSGGSGSLGSPDLVEAPVAREVLQRLGLPPERVLFEGASRNTYENVRLSQEAVKPRPGETWVLITSAAHMPRSVGIFRRLGWPVLPYPVAFRTGRDAGVPPSGDAIGTLAKLDGAVHEWVGLLAYHLLDRTDAWFPAPAPEPASSGR